MWVYDDSFTDPTVAVGVQLLSSVKNKVKNEYGMPLGSIAAVYKLA